MSTPQLAFLFVIVVLAGGFASQCARAHDPYGSWMRPDAPGQSCCNLNDCRPTRAFKHDDGRWRAWDGHAWLTVPPEKMLPIDMAGDGRNHLCAAPDGRVFCFSPTGPRS